MKKFAERTADLLFDFARFIAATVIIGRVFVSLDVAKITNADFVLAISLFSVALLFGYVFDFLSVKRGQK
ncbi:MAG: hypothetical protein FWF51_06585 [Chitinivibrionia bacterium]|nr:hypothetical protein [Chitinivibrionia bacterium]